MQFRGSMPGILVLFAALAGVWTPSVRGADEPAAAAETAAAEAAAAEAAAEADEDYYELLRLFVDTLDQVERNYVRDLSRRELMEAAIEGMLSKLDQHSDYIAPQELERFRSDVEAEFGGIGIQVSKPSPQHDMRIISPLAGSPAYRAGIAAGDVITHINGEPVDDMSVPDAVKRIKGQIGTAVEITVRRPHDGRSETFKVDRQIVRVETVLGDCRRPDATWEYMFDADQKIGYLRISAFARHTTSELQKALNDLKARGLRGLVIDLRNNPGGLLSAAIQVSDMFVGEGRIVSTSGRNVRERKWDAHRRGTFDGFPIAVIVNRYSASASEIVAACLQDHKRAVVVGERTFGKGSVQNIIELERGRSALKLTTARYLRPSGKNIHRFAGAAEEDEWGVSPDEGFEVKLSARATFELAEDRARRDIIARSDQPPAEPAEADEAKPAASGDGKPADTEDGKPADTEDGKPADTEAGKPADTEAGKPADTEAEKPPEADDGKPAVPGPADERPVDAALEKALAYVAEVLSPPADKEVARTDDSPAAAAAPPRP